MKKLLCIDFEMLCHEKGMLKRSGTIIEIGACILGENGIESEFSSYIKPICNKPINAFTQDFIGANSADFENAPEFTNVMRDLDEWCKPHFPSIRYWAAWGDMDYFKIIESFREIKQRKSRCFSLPFYDAQVAFQQKNYIYDRIGLNGAIEMVGFEHTLKTHKAIDDAKKLALLIHNSEIY